MQQRTQLLAFFSICLSALLRRALSQSIWTLMAPALIYASSDRRHGGLAATASWLSDGLGWLRGSIFAMNGVYTSFGLAPHMGNFKTAWVTRLWKHTWTQWLSLFATSLAHSYPLLTIPSPTNQGVYGSYLSVYTVATSNLRCWPLW